MTQLKTPTGRRQTSWLFTKCGGHDSGLTQDKSRQWSEWDLNLEHPHVIQHPDHWATLPLSHNNGEQREIKGKKNHTPTCLWNDLSSAHGKISGSLICCYILYRTHVRFHWDFSPLWLIVIVVFWQVKSSRSLMVMSGKYLPSLSQFKRFSGKGKVIPSIDASSLELVSGRLSWKAW